MNDHCSTSATTARSRSWLRAACVACALLAAVARPGAAPPQGAAAGAGAPAVITVNVSHPAEDGEVACALFATAEGFPDAAAQSRGVVHPAQGTSATCTFADVAAGTYAVAVVLDMNRNGKANTNFLGIPTNPRDLSNDARPTMRAPNFAEASFTVEAGARLTVAVQLK